MSFKFREKDAQGRTHSWPSCPVPWPKHICPLSLLSPTGLHSHCSSLTAFFFYPLFFNLVMKILIVFWYSRSKRKLRLFSTTLYLDFAWCCLPKFKMNPPQTVTAMSALCPCTRACASVSCRSPPLQNMPGLTKHAVFVHRTEHSHSSKKLDFGGQMCFGTVRFA